MNKHLGIIFTISIYTWLFIMLIYIILLISPRKMFFNYIDVKPLKNEFNVDEVLRFESDREIKIGGKFQYIDTLRCEIEGEFVNFSQYRSFLIQEATNGKSKWQYGSMPPFFPTTCKLDSQIIRILPFGITKEQFIKGQEFKIIYPQQ